MCQHARTESISKRARSTTPTSLDFMINGLRATAGRIVATPEVHGLHHRYDRRAASSRLPVIAPTQRADVRDHCAVAGRTLSGGGVAREPERSGPTAPLRSLRRQIEFSIGTGSFGVRQSRTRRGARNSDKSWPTGRQAFHPRESRFTDLCANSNDSLAGTETASVVGVGNLRDAHKSLGEGQIRCGSSL